MSKKKKGKKPVDNFYLSTTTCKDCMKEYRCPERTRKYPCRNFKGANAEALL